MPERWLNIDILSFHEAHKGYSEKIVKSESDQNKLTFNITYYPVFQNVRNILQKLHILLTPDQEDKKLFQKRRSESCGKRNYQLCDFICNTDTLTTKASEKIFKIQSGILNCNSQKVLYLLKCRMCGEAPYFGKAKIISLKAIYLLFYYYYCCYCYYYCYSC